MKIMTTDVAGVAGAVGLGFGRGKAFDDDGLEHKIFNPGDYPVPPSTSVVSGQVRLGRWTGEAWRVLAVGCHVNGPGELGPAGTIGHAACSSPAPDRP